MIETSKLGILQYEEIQTGLTDAINFIDTSICDTPTLDECQYMIDAINVAIIILKTFQQS